MTQEPGINDVQEPITSAPPEVRKIIERVLQAEKDKLYMKIPRNILSLAKTTTSLLCKVLLCGYVYNVVMFFEKL